MEELIEEKEAIKYFFDSYAVIEILKENSSYKRFIKESVTLTIFNLAEIYYSILNNYDRENANIVYTKYKGAVVELKDETLKEAMKFKKEYKKQRLSYADCIGYIYAKLHNMKFLTGDKEFEEMENVEFVK